MGSVKEEITRLETAKKDIETAIETCGVNVPDTELIDTYASYIRQIPSAVFSGLNVDPVGGADQFIQSIKQTNGLIEATVGGLVSTSNSGLVPKADGNAGTINSQANDYVLTYKGGTIDWYKLPANAFKNDDNNTTYILSGALNGNAYDVTLTPSSGTATGAKVPAMGAASSSAAGTAGLVPAPAKNKHNSFLRGDGTWVVPDNTTYSVMTGATASAAGKSGLVPQPAKGDQGKFLSGAGTWTALPSLSITDSESGNAVTDVEVSGHGITLKRGTTFSVNGHKHSSDDITALTSYIKATTVAAIASTDSLNTALGKLELKADTAYNLVKGAYDGDGTIENLAEILKVLEGISDTDTIKAIIGKYLPLAGGMMTGNITFDSNRMIRWHQSDSYSISCPTGGDGAYLLLKAHNGITAKKRLSIYTNAESLPNTNYNLYTDGSLYAASAVFGGNTKITGGSDLTLQASSGAQGDAGDIVFSDYSGAELGRIWLDSTASQALSLRYGANDAVKRILHSGNSSVSKSGQTLTVKINGVEQSITNSTYSTLPNPYNISFKDTSNNTVTYNGSSALDLTGGIYYAVNASKASTLDCFTRRATANCTWGTLTASNGYTPIYWGDSASGGGIGFSDKGGQTFMQIDGDYYAQEGAYKVWHAGNLTKVSQLTNDSGYLTSLPSHNHDGRYAWGNYASQSDLSDCNSVSSTGFWTHSGFTHRPDGVENWGSLMNIRLYSSNNNYHRQLFFDCYGSDKIWTRSDNGGSWTSWKRLALVSDIPTSLPANGGNADTATSSTSANYSRNLLGRTTSGTDYAATDGNLVFAEWNTHGDSRWCLKAKGYETRVGYANDSDKLDGIDSTGFLRQVTQNATFSSVANISTDLVPGIHSIHISGVEYSSILTGRDFYGSYWQLYFHPSSGYTQDIKYRATNCTTWKTLLDSNNWSSFITIPSVGNGTVTINQAGASKGSFTLNQSTAATIDLTDTNYYPTAFSWTGGTAEGPTGSLTGVGMTAVSFGAIPAATGSASGIVTTVAQSFAGVKTFTGKVELIGGGSGSTSITYDKAALVIGTMSRAGSTNEYYPGIAFNHMYGYAGGSGYRNHAHAWIGLRLESTPGSELSSLIFATQSTTTTGTALTERMCITSGGTVGIGTTNPTTTYKLYVNGSIYGSKLYSTYIQDIHTSYLPFLVGRVYKGPGGTYAYTDNGMPGLTISQSRNRAGRYIMTITNNTEKTVYIHTPIVTPVFGDWGGGSCYESPFAYLDHNYSYAFPVSVATGKTMQFTVICGKIHTQGNWSSGDFTKSNDDGGFSVCVYGSWAS